MKNLIIACFIVVLTGCSVFQKTQTPVVIVPPVYQGVPNELTAPIDDLPYINVETATQDEFAVWLRGIVEKIHYYVGTACSS
jgi:hypothetical protein